MHELQSEATDRRRVTIEKLAPTGEGIARTAEGTGFIAGALPGEDVEVEVTEARKKFWKGRVVGLLSRSPDRVAGPHESCAGCDWAYLDLDRARQVKRDLFLETMARIGGLSPELFGELPIEPSPGGYRLRARLHAAGRGREAAVGYYAPRTHRVESARNCDALSRGMRDLLSRLAEPIASSGAPLSEISIAEDLLGSAHLARIVLAPEGSRRDAHALEAGLRRVFDGLVIVSHRGERWSETGSPFLWHEVGGRRFPVTAGVFFQVNRHLLSRLYQYVRAEAALPPGLSLDAFGGVGLFAGALADAGHRVVSVEASSTAVALAAQAKKRGSSGHEDDWRIVHSAMLPFMHAHTESFDLAVVDPPRAGLGAPLAAMLAERVRDRIIYVSCDPATLARDLAMIQSRGYRVARARIYDLFAFTHRLEAVVTLERSDNA